MAKAFHIALGKKGERRACEYLADAGYVIIERNYVCPCGEIDVIARDGSTLCFIEIKTRSSALYGFPAEAIDKRKRRKIVQTALFYCSAQNRSFQYYRFDTLELIFDAKTDRFSEIVLTQEAFSADSESAGS